MRLKIKDCRLLTLFLFFLQSIHGQINDNSTKNVTNYLLFKKYKSSDLDKVLLFKTKDTFDLLRIDNFLEGLGYNSKDYFNLSSIHYDSVLEFSKKDKMTLLSMLTSPANYKNSYQIGDTVYLDGYADCFDYDHCIRFVK